MANKDDLYYISEAISNIDSIISYTKGLSYEKFMADPKTIDATMFRLQQMAENIKKISFTYKAKHNNIPWGDIIGFRNGIVHDYGQTDYTTVYEIITVDIYNLKKLFKSSFPK